MATTSTRSPLTRTSTPARRSDAASSARVRTSTRRIHAVYGDAGRKSRTARRRGAGGRGRILWAAMAPSPALERAERWLAARRTAVIVLLLAASAVPRAFYFKQLD